mmetsp:Transcript_20521/g.42994  ORF Transcript_20521/g.42994 Transcript_20521/m.42994 type:complete len:831 (-) Transcript_20521:175-2667(-)
MTEWKDWSALPSLGSAATTSSVRQDRSMASLQVASQALLAQSSHGVPPPSSGGHSWRFSTNNAAPKPAATHMNAQEAVTQHQQNILNDIMTKPDQVIQEETDRAINDFLQKSWERKHKQWSEELAGGRGASVDGNMLMDTTNTSSYGGQQALTQYGSASGSHRALLPDKSGGGVLWPRDHGGSMSQLDPQIIHTHAKVVEELKRLMGPDAARTFGNLIDPSSAPANSGYFTAWKWMELLLEHQQKIMPSSFGGAYSTKMDPVGHAIATVCHLSCQFRIRMEQTTQSALMAGQNDLLEDTYDHAVAKHCEAFTKLQLGAAFLETPWATLYYCLRCGYGDDAALEVWQISKLKAGISDTVADAITRLLDAMTPWDKADSVPMLPNSDRHIVGDFLQTLQANIGEDKDQDIHQVGVLALLSGAGDLPVSNNIPGFGTIEDYLFGMLCKCLLQREPVEELSKLGESIQNYGPSYFGDAESGGWSYTLPLLMTQQYNKALSHLVDFGGDLGLLHASHLGLLMSTSKIELTDLGETNPPVDDLAASLLVAYAGRLLAVPSAGSVAALEYLVLIPKRERMMKEVASMIAKTGDLERLAGKPDENGVAYGGDVLDRKFSKSEIAVVLGEAAEMLLRENDDEKAGLAARCYLIAGRYDSVLWMLNQKMDRPEDQTSNRQYWIEQTMAFRSYYLEKRTQVVETLERQGKMSLIETNRFMIDLNIFFQEINVQRFQEAWNIVQNTQLLPMSSNDLGAKQDKYRNLDDVIKRSFPAVLVGAMKCLHYQHQQTKAGGGARDAVTIQRLKELQAHAKVLLSFSGMLGVASDQSESLSHLEATMI